MASLRKFKYWRAKSCAAVLIVSINETKEIYDRLRLVSCTKNKKKYKYHIRSRHDNKTANLTFFFSFARMRQSFLKIVDTIAYLIRVV